MRLYWATIPKNHPQRKYASVQIHTSHTMLDAVEQHLGFLTAPQWDWDETHTKFKISETSEPDVQIAAAWETNDVTKTKTTWLKITG